MSGPFGSSQFMYETGAAEEGQSLRFEDGDSPSFSFTFGTPTNQIKWTMSFWCKRGEIGREHAIYGAANGGGETFFVAFYPDDIEAYISSGRNHVTNAVFRDPSAWYHIVQVFDSANATADDRFITYVNGVRQTTSTNSVALNDTTAWNTSGVTGYFGKNYGAWFGDSRDHFDGYLANVCFIDGTALDPTSFGEYQDTLWKPKSDTDIQSLTFGTNGFYLPFKQTTEAEGFSTVTYTGNGGTQSIEGVGFEPDFVWLKNRDTAYQHGLYDSVRGASRHLETSQTDAEEARSGVTSFDSNGFTLGSDNLSSYNGSGYVAWCWDAGTGSAASNTDGSISSSVKANTAKGFSIVSYTGTGANATVGHGLSSAPEMIITKWRTGGTSQGWPVYHSSIGNTKYLALNLTDAESANSTLWNNTSPTSTNFSIGTNTWVNGSSWTYISYCFHSVSGYSSIGSYSGTGAAGNKITTGFKPAFVLLKDVDATDNWRMYDNTRSPSIEQGQASYPLYPNLSNAEDTSTGLIEFLSDGFEINSTSANNTSGNTQIYMAFADTRDATFFGDTSGNGNNWTPNALNNTDVVPDSPVTGGNFAVMNPVDDSGFTFAEGNLKATSPTLGGCSRATIAMESGKWYWEVLYSSKDTGSDTAMIGILATDSVVNTYAGTLADAYVYYALDGTKYNNGSGAAYGASYTEGDIIGVTFDADNGDLTFYKNGSSQGTAFTGLTSKVYAPVLSDGSGATAITFIANFGQDSSFAGNATPQGNTDDNGVGDFYYAPPSGYLALTTGNLPAATITAPDEHFNTVLYSGTGSSQSITGINFQPDWIWWKGRNASSSHLLMNAVVGNTKYLYSNSTAAEQTDGTNVLTSFDSDGFTLPADTGGYANFSGRTYVAWNWLAGGTAVSNTDGSITSQVSANTDAGFSVVSYTGNGTDGASIGHGLGTTPSMVICKRRDTAQNWVVAHSGITLASQSLALNLTTQATSFGDGWIDAWDSTTFTANQGSASIVNVNANTGTYIAYCFAEVEGYSKMGSYTGNGSTDGTYVHCGLRPAWIMVKRTDAASSNGWYIYDNKRENYGTLVDAMIYANLSNAEDNGGRDLDFTANGFKPRLTDVNVNASGGSYIFLAFAEAPFKSANAR